LNFEKEVPLLKAEAILPIMTKNNLNFCLPSVDSVVGMSTLLALAHNKNPIIQTN
jgi:hypothetical protein